MVIIGNETIYVVFKWNELNYVECYRLLKPIKLVIGVPLYN